MFRKSYNRAVVRLRIETVTPLLIRAGDAGLDPTAADLTPVRTRHGSYGKTVYIPGSSLKGVLRSASEAAMRGQQFSGVEGACDPLDGEKSCSEQLQNRLKKDPKLSSAEIHKQHCLACRLYGSLKMKGRASVRDLFPWSEGKTEATQVAPGGANHVMANQLELRQGVAIDRLAGSVKHGPFDQELVPAGVSFWGEIALENYQIWQLGLLRRAFAEMNDGFAQLGSSKSRGLGVARIDVHSILHEQVARDGRKAASVGSLVSQEERRAYGLFEEDPDLPGEGELRGLSLRFSIEAPEMIAAWLKAGESALAGLR